MHEAPILAIIGGSGLNQMSNLENRHEHHIETPFGETSAPIVTGNLAGNPIAFLVRHGFGHRYSPSEVPYRANIYALKSMGIERIISVSACGSLREDYVPGEIVIPNQLFDYTRIRPRSFFGEGLVAHISVADPFCPELSDQIYQAIQTAGGSAHRGGALITIEGPRFSTRIESNTFRSWGLSLINMTSVPEAFLAREAEMCYAVINHVTDYDVWHLSEEPVTVEMVIKKSNTDIIQEAIRNLVLTLPRTTSCDCGSALPSSLITRPEVIPAETRERLRLLVDKYLP